MIYSSITLLLCLLISVTNVEGYSHNVHNIWSKRGLALRATTDNRGLGGKTENDAYNIIILGDLHLNPHDMEEHLRGRDHFKSIVNDRNGNLRLNTCVVSLGDLGESKPVHPDSKEIFSGTTGSFKLAREYLDGFGAPFEVIGGNHDLEGIEEFPTDETNLEAYLSILGKETPQFKRLIAPKTMLVGLGSTVFREARYTSHEVIIEDDQVIKKPFYSLTCGFLFFQDNIAFHLSYLQVQWFEDTIKECPASEGNNER